MKKNNLTTALVASFYLIPALVTQIAGANEKMVKESPIGAFIGTTDKYNSFADTAGSGIKAKSTLEVQKYFDGRSLAEVIKAAESEGYEVEVLSV